MVLAGKRMYDSIVGRTIKMKRAQFIDMGEGFQIRLPKGMQGEVLKVVISPPQAYVHFKVKDTEITCWVNRQFTELLS